MEGFMTELKFERKETLNRDEAVSRLRAIADALDGNDRQAELELGHETISLPVGEEMQVEIEVELDDDELELEIELKWAVRERATKTGAKKSDSH
jgi:amphi-Trp domain-containing protein